MEKQKKEESVMEEVKSVLKAKNSRCRRSNGEGSAHKRGDTWYGQFSITRNHKLIRKGFTADSKLELLEKGFYYLSLRPVTVGSGRINLSTKP